MASGLMSYWRVWQRIGARDLRTTFGRSELVFRSSRRHSSGRVGGAGDSSTFILLTGVGLLGVGGYLVYRQSSAPNKTLVEMKKEGYKEAKSVHPEAVAEAQASTTGVPDTPGPKAEGPPKAEEGKEEEILAHRIPSQVQYVLIGAGTASHACAKAIRECDPKAKVLIIGEEEFPPYMRPPLSKALWQEREREMARALKFKASWTDGKYIDVFYKGDYVDVSELVCSAEGATSVLTGHRVTHLNTADKEVTLRGGHKIKYDKCLIATGGTPKNLPVFKSASDDVKEKVSVFRKIPDFLSLEEIATTKQSVLVVGGGFLGSELAVALADKGKANDISVSQLFPEDGNLGLVLPKALTKWTTERVREEGVNVMPNCTVDKVDFSDGKVCVTTSTGQQLKVDQVLVAVGLQPNTSLAGPAGLEVDPTFGGYRVNSELQACSDVWVAGDVSSFYDPHLGRRRVEHHDHANVSGRLAGENMTGAGKPFNHQSMFWSDIGPKVGFEAVGLIDSNLPTVGIWAKSTPLLSQPPTPAQEPPKALPSPDKLGSSEVAGDDFSKGMVFYMKEGVIVGVLTWNMFGKMDQARKVIAACKIERDIPKIINEFDIH